MWKQESGPVPFQISTMINVKSSSFSDINSGHYAKSSEMHHAYNFADENQNVKLRSFPNSFPNTRAVLWNRKATGEDAILHLIGPSRKVMLLINERTLCLVQKQLEVVCDTYIGFFIASIRYTDESVIVDVNRFDPGRPSRDKLSEKPKNVKLPTTILPGDVCIPVTLNKGMAFVDHASTETYTSTEFLRAFYILNSWFSRKEKLDANNFVNLKMKCSFMMDNDDVLAYISACFVHVSGDITIQPVNSIPIIPTALARNLEGQLTLDEMDNRIQTGYLTMDQTRKLLLLLDTDPKAFTLPLVGVWLCGVDGVDSVEVWSCCMRFLQNENISERVYVPPCNYLFALFSPINVNPLFYEFSSKNSENGFGFKFRGTCEGVQLKKSGEDDIHFDLSSQSSGLLHNNFKTALSLFHNGSSVIEEEEDEEECARKGDQEFFDQNQMLDDSVPQILHSLSPHPQQNIANVPNKQATLDVSLSESSSGNSETTKEIPMPSSNGNGDSQEERPNRSPTVGKTSETDTVPKNKSIKQQNILKNPRPTKASIIRMNLNKPVQKNEHKQKNVSRKTLSVNFGVKSQSQNNTKEDSVATKEEMLQKVDHFIQFQNNLIESNAVTFNQCQNTSDHNVKPNHSNVEQSPHDESLPRIPVAIRHDDNNETMLSVLEPTYCPENYSDFEARSFVIENTHNSSSSFNETNSDEMNTSQLKITEPNSNINRSKKDTKTSERVKSPHFVKEHSEEIKNNSLSKKLYDLVLGQQKQLSSLKEQLQLFMNHQEKKKDEHTEQVNEQAKNEVVTTNDLLTIRHNQRNQLEDLQKQVQLFLQQTSAAKTNAIEMSTQYSMTEVAPPRTSIGVNTGDSLLWPAENMASTGSDTTPRGTKQAEGLAEKKRLNSARDQSRKPCRCCLHCHKQKDSSISSSGQNDTHTEHLPLATTKESFEQQCIESFDIQSDDIQTPSLLNKTANSEQTIASSLKGVDIPVFDDTQEDLQSETQHQLTNLYDWEKSPKLGESASVLVEKRRKQQQQQQQQQHDQELDYKQQEQDSLEQSNNIEERNEPGNNQEFYAEMMNQVQKLMEVQNISPQRNNKIEEKVSSAVEQYPEPPVVSPEQRLMRVRNATLRELQKITAIDKPCTKNRPRSMSANSPPHPKINYVSMSVDDTIYDYSHTKIDSIYAKYLPTEYLSKHQNEIKNKTVKFEGVYKWETPGRHGIARNMTSVNFSCNMSIASRKYLKKYELIDNEEHEAVAPLNDHNGRQAVTYAKKVLPFTSEPTDVLQEKENILDLNKLRNLPKLK